MQGSGPVNQTAESASFVHPGKTLNTFPPFVPRLYLKAIMLLLKAVG